MNPPIHVTSSALSVLSGITRLSLSQASFRPSVSSSPSAWSQASSTWSWFSSSLVYLFLVIYNPIILDPRYIVPTLGIYPINQQAASYCCQGLSKHQEGSLLLQGTDSGRDRVLYCQAQLKLQLQLSWKLSYALFSLEQA